MSVKVGIPTVFKKYTGDKDCIEVEAGSVSETMKRVIELHPGLKDRIFDESGKLRRFVNIYVNGEDIRFMDGLETKVPGGGEISILPAIAGG